MCGIGAILDPTGLTPSDGAERLLAALRHRGPDGEASVRAGPVVMAFTRLAIIDVEGGAQPFASGDGARLAVVNGEIYNHVHLRRELQAAGHEFRTRSDCETVLHAYEQYGPACVNRLNGIFAFIVWDEARERLLAARDHYGVKPLYWWSDGRRVALASEVRALLATGLVQPMLDRVALDHFLALGFVPSPRTLFAGVQKLAPATTLRVNRSEVRMESYREAPGEPHDAPAPELEAELRRRFLDAVDRQMMSEVPYGAFLSAGIDSAAIAAAMSERSGTPPRTFTIGFPDFVGRAVDERGGAARTAAALGADHHETTMLRREFPSELRRYMRHLEEPCGRPSSPALRRLSRFASRSVKVVLAGQGADECFGGYVQHQWAGTLWPSRHLPVGVAAAIRAFGAVSGARWAGRATRMVEARTDDDWLLSAYEWTTADTRSELLGGGDLGERAERERHECASAILADVDGRSLLERALYLDTHMILPDRLLIPGDKLSMAASLEYRVPFLDVELMRFVHRLPGRLRTRSRDRKRLLRRATSPLLPPEIRKRPKQGFVTPYADELRGAMGQEIERRLGPRGSLADVVSPAAVRRVVAHHREGRANHRLLLHCLHELAEWHRCFVDDPASELDTDPDPSD